MGTLVAIRIRNPAARDIVRSGARLAHLRELVLQADDDALPVGTGLLVDDLAPWNESVLSRIAEFRIAYPRVPVLAYRPRGVTYARVAAQVAELPGVVTMRQAPEAPGEADDLKATMLELLDRVPEMAVRAAIARCLSNADPRIRPFADLVVDWWASGRRPTVGDLRRELGVVERTFERLCTDTDLPPPQHLLDLVSFLYIAYAAWWRGESAAQAAKRLGLFDKAWWRLRRSVLRPHLAEHSDIVERDLLHLAILAFAEACHVPVEQAVELRRALTA
jgi:hypothetical protein